MTIRVAIPDLISPSYVPAIAAVEMGFLPGATLELLYPVTKTYEQLRADHIRDYRALFDRVTIDLGKPTPQSALPTDERPR